MFIYIFNLDVRYDIIKRYGPNRDLNPGPPAPKAGIIPLDHLALYTQIKDVRLISFEHTVDA